MVQNVVVEVDSLEPLLYVYICKMFLPCNFRSLLRVQVDPYEAIYVNVNMDREQTIL